MRKVHLVIITLLTNSIPTIVQAATYGGGSGTAQDPYQIWTPQQMNTIGLNPGDWSKHYKLMADIDMSAFTGTQYKIIGNTTTKFTGTFDGNGHIISNLTYITTNSVRYVSLFGLIESATIQNLGLEYITLSTGGGDVGGLVGDNKGIIISCYVNGSISGTTNVGGLVGYNRGVIISCYATGSISGTTSVGGLVGNHSSGQLTSCYASALVNGSSAVGGLVGYRMNGTDTACFWDIQTSGQRTSAGGRGKTTTELQMLNTFINAGWDFINESANGLCDYWRIELNDYPRLAVPTWTLQGEGTFDNPYIINNTIELGKVWFKPNAFYRLGNDLDLTGVFWLSAVVPEFSGTFDGKSYEISNLTITQYSNQYVGLFGSIDSSGQITNLGIENVNITGHRYVGGLAGSNYGTIISCYSSGSVNGDNDVGGLVGISYGTIISSIANSSLNGYARIGGLVGYNSGPLISCHTTGSTTGISYVGGLTGYNEDSIKSCYTTGSVRGIDYLTMISENVGGLVGYNYPGSINSCYSTGSVIGSSNVGGLVGYNAVVPIKFSYATGSVRGTKWIGGLVGGNSTGSIISCYATGLASGTGNYIGGLVGSSNGLIASCYATGFVSGRNYIGGLCGIDYGLSQNCFWDMETSGRTTSAGGIGKTTVDMKTLSTFTSAGWDIAGEVENGLNEIWRMCFDGIAYPKLSWEYGKNGDFACPDGVGIEDLEALAYHWLTADSDPAFNYACDGSGDGYIGLEDLALLSQNWTESYLVVSANYLLIGAIEGESNPSPKELIVKNTGGGILEWMIESEEPMPGWLSMDPVSGTLGRGEGEPVALSVDISGLTIGEYEYTFDVVDPNALNSPQTVTVTLVIAPPLTTPAAYWALDEEGGTTAIDSSGNDHHGALVNFADPDGIWMAGRIGNCLAFDGSDDHVAAFEYQGIGGGQSRTVCAWIRTTQLSGGILNYGSVGTGTRWIFFVNEDGKLQLGISGGNIISTQIVADGQWHHVAAVLEAPAEGPTRVQHLQLYIDGQPAEGTYTNPDTEINTVLEYPVRIGAIEGPAGTLGSYLNGLIDEVGMFDSALSVGQIALLSIEPPLPAPAAYWALDETEGVMAADSSGNDYHGTLNFVDPNNSWMAGKVGNCLKFDDENENVATFEYQGIGGYQSRTVCAWIRTTQLSGGILNYGSVGTGTRWIFFVNENGKLQLGISGGNIISTQIVADGQWHHVAAVLKAPETGSTLVKHLHLYIDGQPVEGTYTNPNTEINTVLQYPVRIGVIEGPAWTLGSYFNGLIDEVRMYNAALSEDQIALLAAE